MKYLVTGGCGFVGHHFVEHVIKSNQDAEIIVIDKLTYSSNGFDRLRDISVFDNKRIKIFTHDIVTPFEFPMIKEFGQVDYVVHMAAETHVDHSIRDPRSFVMTNVVGTLNMLEMARILAPRRFLYFSTDEVFGNAGPGENFKEWDRYRSRNPYAAAKAGGEELALAFENTFHVPVLITHTMNLMGERQHPEKFIPMCIRKIMKGEVVTIHADQTKTVSGSRMYIHCRNAANAVDFVLNRGVVGDKYNVVGEKEVSNLEMAEFIAKTLGKELKYEMVDFHSSRPGHDLRYALDGTRMREMGWEIPVSFEDSLKRTIQWYVKHPNWLGL